MESNESAEQHRSPIVYLTGLAHFFLFLVGRKVQDQHRLLGEVQAATEVTRGQAGAHDWWWSEWTIKADRRQQVVNPRVSSASVTNGGPTKTTSTDVSVHHTEHHHGSNLDQLQASTTSSKAEGG